MKKWLREQKVVAVILAGGRGMRMGGNYKQFLKINGRELIFYSLDEFLKCRFIREIIIIVPSEKFSFAENLIFKRYGHKSKIKLMNALRTRQLSVRQALLYLKKEKLLPDFTMFHDAVRPFVTKEMIESVAREAMHFGGAVVGAKAVDLILEADKKSLVRRALKKPISYCGYTPQCFDFREIFKVHERAPRFAAYSFDNIELLEKYNDKFKIKIIDWPTHNIKITYPADIIMAKHLLKI